MSCFCILQLLNTWLVFGWNNSYPSARVVQWYTNHQGGVADAGSTRWWAQEGWCAGGLWHFSSGDGTLSSERSALGRGSPLLLEGECSEPSAHAPKSGNARWAHSIHSFAGEGEASAFLSWAALRAVNVQTLAHVHSSSEATTLNDSEQLACTKVRAYAGQGMMRWGPAPGDVDPVNSPDLLSKLFNLLNNLPRGGETGQDIIFVMKKPFVWPRRKGYR